MVFPSSIQGDNKINKILTRLQIFSLLCITTVPFGTSLTFSYGELPVVGAHRSTWRVKSTIIALKKSHMLYYGKENHFDFLNKYFEHVCKI